MIQPEMLQALGKLTSGPEEGAPEYGVCPMQLKRVCDGLVICGQRNYSPDECDPCQRSCVHYQTYQELRNKSAYTVRADEGWQQQKEELKNAKTEDCEGQVIGAGGQDAEPGGV